MHHITGAIFPKLSASTYNKEFEASKNVQSEKYKPFCEGFPKSASHAS